MLAAQIIDFEGFAFGLNYGLDRVRFPAPMPVGGKVRGTSSSPRSPTSPAARRSSSSTTLEREGGDKPVCVAEALARFYAGVARHVGSFAAAGVADADARPGVPAEAHAVGPGPLDGEGVAAAARGLRRADLDPARRPSGARP